MLGWKKKAERFVYQGYRSIIKKTFELPDGREADFDIIDGQNIVAALALTPENEVILVKQFRPGPERYFLDLPAGGIEKGETPEEAMARELREETGFEGDLIRLGEGFSSGYSTAYRYHFVAVNCRQVGELIPDENEFLEVVRMPLAEFRKEWSKGILSSFADVATCFFAIEHLNLGSI